ncbi:unnamed protein product [Arabidopsis arenosa]|uniref:Uncharacterized protein n=1 Tax=Arabidopsis arenosa TaxID=38785 RepID=A0A8S1ZU22_ARAAE|nr:unnamed protein product [Arabidopsis arenosa]
MATSASASSSSPRSSLGSSLSWSVSRSRYRSISPSSACSSTTCHRKKGNFGEIIHVELAIDRAVDLPIGDAYVEFKARADAEKPQLYMDGGDAKKSDNVGADIEKDDNHLCLGLVDQPDAGQYPLLEATHKAVSVTSKGGFPSRDPWQSCSKTFSSKVASKAATQSKKKISNLQKGRGSAGRRRGSSSYSSSPSPHKAPRKLSKSHSPEEVRLF